MYTWCEVREWMIFILTQRRMAKPLQKGWWSGLLFLLSAGKSEQLYWHLLPGFLTHNKHRSSILLTVSCLSCWWPGRSWLPRLSSLTHLWLWPQATKKMEGWKMPLLFALRCHNPCHGGGSAACGAWGMPASKEKRGIWGSPGSISSGRMREEV